MAPPWGTADRSLLAGIRVLDLSQIRAGPKTARWLADAGAEVIKIESLKRPDRGGMWIRLDLSKPVPEEAQREWNRTAGLGFDQLHRNKLGLSLDLTTERGKELLERLVRISDVLVENFSAGVMERLGFGYNRLRALRPEIIVLSMPAFGTTGPYRDHVGFGWGLEHQSGITALTGYLGDAPMRTGTITPDPLNGVHGAAAVAAALVQRRLTGRGQFIELAHWESTVALIGEAVLEQSFNGTFAGRLGNRHRVHAPQGCYRCAGGDEWVALTVTSGDEWAGLCRALGRLELASDARFATAAERRAHHDELDAIIGAWMAGRGKHEAMEALQQHGVPAGAVLDNAEALTQEHFRARGFFQTLPHPDGVEFPYMNGPWRFSRTPVGVREPAPLLGEDNEYVLGELLGLSAGEIAELESSGVTARLSTPR
ncbi:MAG: CoA transferase [Chloroflexi bacterium]|nr:CoA transferase [Chloroflexota bacterium]